MNTHRLELLHLLMHRRRRHRNRILGRPMDVDINVSSEDEEFFIRNENSFWIINQLSKSIGRSRICVVREHYLDLFSVTRARETSEVFSTPLHIAATKNKRLSNLEFVLKNPKTDKNVRNRYGETAVLLALKENVSDDMINMLLDYGCDCTTGCFRGVTPLHVVAFDNKVHLLLKLIERGADVNTVSNIGITPLHLAVLAGHYETVYELLNHNANPKMTTILEFTPSMLALGFRDVDIRICELLLSHDRDTATRIGNPVYCAIKAQHCFAKQLVLDGADVNHVGHNNGRKMCCLLECIALNDKRLFDLIWPRFDQEVFRKKFTDFLEYFVNYCELRGSDLVGCLRLILTCNYGSLLVRYYFQKVKRSFLENFFENVHEYGLTRDDCCLLISSMPIVYYEDVSYVYRRFGFDKELVSLLWCFKYDWELLKKQTKFTNIYIDYICFNGIKTDVYNLREILHFLKYCTPDSSFRSHFYSTFSGIAVSNDIKLERLITLYKLCEEMLVKRPIASLQELSRDNLRKILFNFNENPYKAITVLPIPDVFKDILFLKMPIYC